MKAESLFILYVRDQEISCAFYRTVLGCPPRLHVPGMTEFVLNEGAVLGLMPQAGIVRLLGPALPDPAQAQGVPRAELYLRSQDARRRYANACAAGARCVSDFAERSWGDTAAYLLDPDGHVLALALSPSHLEPAQALPV